MTFDLDWPLLRSNSGLLSTSIVSLLLLSEGQYFYVGCQLSPCMNFVSPFSEADSCGLLTFSIYLRILVFSHTHPWVPIGLEGMLCDTRFLERSPGCIHQALEIIVV